MFSTPHSLCSTTVTLAGKHTWDLKYVSEEEDASGGVADGLGEQKMWPGKSVKRMLQKMFSLQLDEIVSKFI